MAAQFNAGLSLVEMGGLIEEEAGLRRLRSYLRNERIMTKMPARERCKLQTFTGKKSAPLPLPGPKRYPRTAEQPTRGASVPP
jgi:hypothetical protein